MSALKMVKNNHDRERAHREAKKKEAEHKKTKDSNERDPGAFSMEEERGSDPPEQPKRRRDPAGKTPKSTV